MKPGKAEGLMDIAFGVFERVAVNRECCLPKWRDQLGERREI